MPSILHAITFIFLFASVNFEVFLLITYFEKRKDMKEEENFMARGVKKYPTVTVIIPCWNEETTVGKTIHSLLNLDYPKDKLKILVVDDGSSDNTWQVVQKFKSNPQVELFHKENGGKYTALNFGLSKTASDLVGCLDADSYVDKDALKYIVTYFQDRKVMAVAPSIKLWKPKGVLQLLQKVEYGFGIFTRKLFQYMEAVYITPGPLSIFRREVFEKLGNYRHAHNTEDIEIALRMQKNGYKIAHAHKAVVYTVAPHRLKPLLKQRVRWSHGFIKNAMDYREMFFSRKYGNLGMFVLPMAGISLASVMSVAVVSIINFIRTISTQYIKIKTVGFDFHFDGGHFDWFFINTQLIFIISIIAFIGTITLILTSRKMSEGKLKLNVDLIYYFVLYIFIAPIWIFKATWNAVFSVKASWR